MSAVTKAERLERENLHLKYNPNHSRANGEFTSGGGGGGGGSLPAHPAIKTKQDYLDAVEYLDGDGMYVDPATGKFQDRNSTRAMGIATSNLASDFNDSHITPKRPHSPYHGEEPDLGHDSQGHIDAMRHYINEVGFSAAYREARAEDPRIGRGVMRNAALDAGKPDPFPRRSFY